MGSGSFNAAAYRSFASTTTGKSTDEIYSSRKIHKNLDPKGVKLRESRDSSDNPNSTPVIVAIDVTGSMGIIADVIVRSGLGVIFTNILDKKPITNPHLMFMGVGDANCDSAPLQVSQFEADNRIVEQLTQIYIEHGGGGNNFESYNLPWYFAANHTEHDSYVKRAKRGYLFTIGDEEVPKPLKREQIKQFIGEAVEADLSSEELLESVQRTYDVFHIMIAEGSHAKSYPERVRDSWTKLMGQKAVWLKDYTKLAETIVSIIQVSEGEDASEVTKVFGSVVHDAVKNLPKSRGSKLIAA